MNATVKVCSRRFHTKVVGVTKENDWGDNIQELLEGFSALRAENLTLEFEHESDNSYDENAVKVICDSAHIGYLSRDVAKQIVDLVDANMVEGEVCEITGGGAKSYGCNILIKILNEPNKTKEIPEQWVYTPKAPPQIDNQSRQTKEADKRIKRNLHKTRWRHFIFACIFLPLMLASYVGGVTAVSILATLIFSFYLVLFVLGFWFDPDDDDE